MSKQKENDVAGRIFDIKRFALHDGPGIRTTVFLKGCPLACVWCHNPEGIEEVPELMYNAEKCLMCGECVRVCQRDAILPEPEQLQIDRSLCDTCLKCVESCPTGAMEMSGSDRKASEIVSIIERDVAFFEQSGGGVTFSGGEPFCQPDFLNSLLRQCRERHIHTAVDTSGYVTTDVFCELLPLIDILLYDIKLLDREKHIQYVGASNDLILENLREADRRGTTLILRVPLIHGINDDDGFFDDFVRLASRLRHLRAVHILPYHSLYIDKLHRLGGEMYQFHTPEIDKKILGQFTLQLEQNHLSVVIGG